MLAVRPEGERSVDDGTIDEHTNDGVRNTNFLAGSEGIWTFIFIDMVIFALIFFVYTCQRMQEYRLYEESHRSLNVILGFSNTLILLTSSLFVARAVQTARQKDAKKVSPYLTTAIVLGASFCGIKVVEYAEKTQAGIGVVTNSFFTFYFFVTFLHLLHVLVGLLFIGIFRRNAKNLGHDRQYLTGLENVALFWHFVDILWVFIYSLLYLM
jgi:nitric oxide reductase NorE protein